MKHVIFGGDGFVGRHLAKKLIEEGEEVLVADVVKSDLAIYDKCAFIRTDVTDAEQVNAVDIQADDMVYNMSAKMLSPIMKRAERYDFFWPVNYYGAKNIVEKVAASDCSSYVQFTTDMVYGHTVQDPQDETHPVAPIGEYGASKWRTEEMCQEWRDRGMNISIFRPRLIIGPGRLGILGKLFKLIDYSLPVPMIGSGKVPYQFISVYDCAEASYLAWKKGVPNEAFNLGSSNPPSVREL
ncbi:MAG: NAD(P)-dependent oxidoreductase, partial [Pseudomonadota bacterium]